MNGEVLLGLARGAIAERFGAAPVPVPPDGWLLERRGVFVTLKAKGALRGCIGQIVARFPLHEAVREAAVSAAFRDPRFTPLHERELAHVRLEVSMLSPLEPLTVTSEEDLLRQLRPGVDGVVLSHQFRSGLFIPEVWKEVPEPREFLFHLKRKAGLPTQGWLPDTQVQRFTATHWEEP